MKGLIITNGVTVFIDHEQRSIAIDKQAGFTATINVCTLLDAILPEWADADYLQSADVMKEWCAVNGCSYYATPKENFSYQAAFAKAAHAPSLCCVVEDLS